MIGILGGTFNPIHYGHLRCAVELKQHFGLAQVRLVPNARPPHRAEPEVSPALRADMVDAALDGHPGLLCDRRELARPAPSYMVDTLVSLRQEFPQTPLLLAIGGDAFARLPDWHEWPRLFNEAHLVVMTRPGFVHPPLTAFYQSRVTENPAALQTTVAGRLYFQTVTALDISASAIRQLIANQQDASFLLPDAVLALIRRHQLYQNLNSFPKIYPGA